MKKDNDWEELEWKLDVLARIYEEMSDEEWEAIVASIPETEMAGVDDKKVLPFGLKKPKDSVIYDIAKKADTTH